MQKIPVLLRQRIQRRLHRNNGTVFTVSGKRVISGGLCGDVRIGGALPLVQPQSRPDFARLRRRDAVPGICFGEGCRGVLRFHRIIEQNERQLHTACIAREKRLQIFGARMEKVFLRGVGHPVEQS